MELATATFLVVLVLVLVPVLVLVLVLVPVPGCVGVWYKVLGMFAPTLPQWLLLSEWPTEAIVGLLCLRFEGAPSSSRQHTHLSTRA